MAPAGRMATLLAEAAQVAASDEPLDDGCADPTPRDWAIARRLGECSPRCSTPASRPPFSSPCCKSLAGLLDRDAGP